MMFEGKDRSQIDCCDANKGKGSQTPLGEMKLQHWTGLVNLKGSGRRMGQCVQTPDRQRTRQRVGYLRVRWRRKWRVRGMRGRSLAPSSDERDGQRAQGDT